MQKEIQILGEKINSSKNILMITHAYIDGDAIGSTVGLGETLKKLGKNIYYLNQFENSQDFKFLGEVNIETEIKDFLPDLIIITDCGDLERIGTLKEKYKELFENNFVVNIDHHLKNPNFGKINIISEGLSSTCELIYEILEELNLDNLIDENAANFLLAGILSDTLMLTIPAVTEKTFFTVGKLKGKNANFGKIAYEFFNKKTLAEIKLLAKIEEKIEIRGEIVGVKIPLKYFDETGANFEIGKKILMGYLMNLPNIKVGFLVYENGENTKCSFRSVEEIEVRIIAEKFGGGGHKNAAAFKSTKSLDEVYEEVWRELENF